MALKVPSYLRCINRAGVECWGAGMMGKRSTRTQTLRFQNWFGFVTISRNCD